MDRLHNAARTLLGLLAKEPPHIVSPEEATLRLLPFRLSSRALPANMTLSQSNVYTPAAMAFESAPAEHARHTVRHLLNQHILLTSLEIVAIDRAGRGVIAEHRLLVLRSINGAQRYVDGKVYRKDRSRYVVARDRRPPALGDACSLWRADAIAGRPCPHSSCLEIRWRRGVLAFQIHIEERDAEKEAIAVDLASWIDQHAATRPERTLAEPTVIAAANERQRLDALLHLATIVPRDAEFPAGVRSIAGPAVGTVASDVAEASDPIEMLRLCDGPWQRVISLSRFAGSGDSATPFRFTFYTLETGSDVAAARNLADDSYGYPCRVEEQTEPPNLGDESRSIRVLRGDGAVDDREQLQIAWRHGRIVLAASMWGPEGTTEMQPTRHMALALEAAYQRSVFAVGDRKQGLLSLAPR